MADNYEDLTKDELQEQAREYGLHTSGNKDDIIARIRAYEDTGSVEEANAADDEVEQADEAAEGETAQDDEAKAADGSESEEAAPSPARYRVVGPDERDAGALETLVVEGRRRYVLPESYQLKDGAGLVYVLPESYQGARAGATIEENELAGNSVATPQRGVRNVSEGEASTDDGKLLIKMERQNRSYRAAGVTFTQEHPFQVVDEDTANHLIDNVGGFRLASPSEAGNYYR